MFGAPKYLRKNRSLFRFLKKTSNSCTVDIFIYTYIMFIMSVLYTLPSRFVINLLLLHTYNKTPSANVHFSDYSVSIKKTHILGSLQSGELLADTFLFRWAKDRSFIQHKTHCSALQIFLSPVPTTLVFSGTKTDTA
jgi:hypothetical protein